MKTLLIIVSSILFIASCAHDAQWKIELETRNQQGYWKSVKQSDHHIYVYVKDGDIYISENRTDIILQVAVLVENGYKDFRYSVGPVIDSKYYPSKFFDSYDRAVNWLDNINTYERNKK